MPRGKQDNDLRPASVFADDADHYSLNEHVVFVDANGPNVVVCRLEPDPAARFAVHPFHGRRAAVDEGHHHLAVVGAVSGMHDDKVTILDVFVDHRTAADAQDITGSAPRDEVLWYRDGLGRDDGFDGLSGSDLPEERKLDRGSLPRDWDHLDRAALVVTAVDVPFAFEIGEVFVHRRQRAEREVFGDFLERRCEAVIGDVALEVIQDLLLSAGERHRTPLRFPNKGRNEYTRTQPEAQTARPCRRLSAWRPMAGTRISWWDLQLPTCGRAGRYRNWVG